MRGRVIESRLSFFGFVIVGRALGIVVGVVRSFFRGYRRLVVVFCYGYFFGRVVDRVFGYLFVSLFVERESAALRVFVFIGGRDRGR